MEPINTINELKKEFSENTNSHVFLVETNDTDSAIIDIKKIIKEKINASPVTSKQIDDENYLELIMIKPDEKDIKKAQIMSLQDRIKTKPILSDYMFYIIKNADTLSEISANKLLKTIEEPNENVIGFLVTTNVDQLLSTIKSRCAHISLNYNVTKQDIPDKELLEIAQKLVYAIETKNHIEFSTIKSQDKIIKENHKMIENIIKDYYNMACNLKEISYLDKTLIQFIASNNPRQTLLKKAKYLNRFLNKLITNMNSDLILESIYLNLKGVN